MRPDAIVAPNSPRDSGVGVVMPRAMKPDWVSKSKVRQTMWRGIPVLVGRCGRGDYTIHLWPMVRDAPFGRPHHEASSSEEPAEGGRLEGWPRRERMATHTIGIILNGATGRICSTQHIANALAPIRDEGGLPAGADRIVPRLMLVGRNAEKLAAVAKTLRRGMDHRPRQGAGRPGLHDLLRRRGDQPAPRRAGKGHRGRQAHLCREAGGAVGRQGPGAAARHARRAG